MAKKEDKWAKRREQGWPFFSVDNMLLAGAMESGKDLYCLGRFGGFGGHLGTVYPELEWAIEEAHANNEKAKAGEKISWQCVYRIKCELVTETP